MSATQLINMDKDFIYQNRVFWSAFPARGYNRKVLIEEPSIPMINHSNAIFSVILNQAKSLTPVWLCNNVKAEDSELFKSYVPTAEFMSFPKVSLFDKIKMKLAAIWKFVIMYLTKDVLSFSYDGVKYGDIVYDMYLKRCSVATIRAIDARLLRSIYDCICRHETIRKILLSDDFDAVLVSHQIGLHSGVMLRAAIRYGYKGYLRAGHHLSTLQCFEKPDEVYDYEYKPFPEDIDRIIATLGSEFNDAYRSIFNKQVSGKGDKDGIYAFSEDNKYYRDRASFVREFGLDAQKKNIFVMLHAFNDYPHSHFRWMLFKDYYDWFEKTLDFARQNGGVNWIFKQHPSIKFYVTKDVSFDSLFSNCQGNIIYIDENKQIDTRSLVHCADLVVTCVGSAGFELPAMGAIPSLIAGDTLYSNLGFAMEPRTKKEYFQILSNAQNLNPLTPEQQKRAQAAYMHIYEFSRVYMPACPIATAEDEKDRNQQAWYWEKVAKLYLTSGELIKNLVHAYIDDVAKPDFKRLDSLDTYCSSGKMREKHQKISV